MSTGHGLHPNPMIAILGALVSNWFYNFITYTADKGPDVLLSIIVTILGAAAAYFTTRFCKKRWP